MEVGNWTALRGSWVCPFEALLCGDGGRTALNGLSSFSVHRTFLWVKFGVQKGIKEGPFHARYRCLLETVESASALEGGSDLSRSRTTPSRRLGHPSPQRLIPLSRVWHPFPAL